MLIVQTPSGNGEVGSINVDAPEYMFAGDTAQVALQYGYAGSFATMVTKPGAGQASATALIDAVYQHLQQMPQAERPRFYVAGESLGSLSTEAAFRDLNDLASRTDGALMVGPTLFNDIPSRSSTTATAGVRCGVPCSTTAPSCGSRRFRTTSPSRPDTWGGTRGPSTCRMPAIPWPGTTFG